MVMVVECGVGRTCGDGGVMEPGADINIYCVTWQDQHTVNTGQVPQTLTLPNTTNRIETKRPGKRYRMYFCMVSIIR